MIVKTYIDDLGLVVYEFTVNSLKEMHRHRWSEKFLNEYDWVEVFHSRRRYWFFGPFIITVKWCRIDLKPYYKLDVVMSKCFNEKK